MRGFYRLFVAGCVSLLLGACTAATVALEPQNRPPDPHQGRLYFIRSPNFMGKTGVANDIRIDGKLIGSLAASSYIAVDRPPGRHTIAIYGVRDPVGFETDIQIEPFVSYYFEVGLVVRTNLDGLSNEMMGNTGIPMPGRYGENTGLMFYSLDPSTGSALVARLREEK
jgi:hypothetical protein